jgi:hypothetical protein
MNEISSITVAGQNSPIKDAEARRVLQAADYVYPGVDLTVKLAAEIAGYSNPWAWVLARIKAANFADIPVGDYIPFRASTGYLIKAEVAGIDTYYKYGDVAVGHHIDFISRDCWPDTHVWNKVNFNNGTTISPSPFLASDIKAWLNSEKTKVPNATTADPALVDVDYTASGVYDKLPAELKAVIVQKRLLAPTRYTAGQLLTDENYWAWSDMGNLWLPYEVEIFSREVWGSRNGYSDHGMQQYARFVANMTRVKGLGDGGTRCHWWLAAAHGGSAVDCCRVGYGGISGGYHGATDSLAAPVCFRIA